ncbi:UNVERIFIED_ORG: hypothetical protein E4P37_12375 [Bacillus sp. AZ43]
MRWTDDEPPEAPTREGAATAARHRRLRTAVLTAIGATVLVVLAVVAGRPEGTEDRTAAPTSAPPTTPSATASTPAPRPHPAHEAELRRVAAGLPALSLSSPASWDQWLPEGKPYPGADLADDLSTCPVLSARLETVVGQDMSYWTGTLPGGPYGCTWVETPLSGQDNDYDYVVSVGFLADGTSVEDVRRYREGPGQGTHPCPSVDLPAVAPGALLARCTGPGTTAYTLAVPDTRLDGGLWFLIASSKDATAVRPADVLPVLVDGVSAAFA